MAKSLGVSKSTAHYRVKRPEGEGMIEGYHARANGAKIGKDFLTLTLYCARYGPGYHERVGKMLAQIPGVWAVHFVLGEIDFIVLARTENRERFMQELEKIINSEEIERTDTLVIGVVLKEDPRI